MLVPLVFPDRSGQARARSEPKGDLQVAVEILVPELEIQRNDVRSNGAVLRQPGFCFRRDSRISTLSRKCARGSVVFSAGTPTGAVAPNNRSVSCPAWRGRYRAPPSSIVTSDGIVSRADQAYRRSRGRTLCAAGKTRCRHQGDPFSGSGWFDCLARALHTGADVLRSGVTTAEVCGHAQKGLLVD